MNVRPARPVCIRVGGEGGVGGGTKHAAKIHSATDIAENPLDRSPVNVSRSMHMKTHLLHGILDLRSSQSEVLESTNDRLIESSIRSRRTIRGRKLGLRINRRSGGLAIKHVGALQELMSVLPLMKEEAIRTCATSTPRK